MNSIYGAIYDERIRQLTLKAQGKFKHTLSDPEMQDVDRIAALMEEVGEVAEAMIEAHGLIGKPKGKNLQKELVQVAAVCVAWLEYLEKQA